MGLSLTGYLILVGISAVVGVIIGFVARAVSPEGSKVLQKFMLNKKWYLYLFSVIVFTAWVVLSYVFQRTFAFWFCIVYIVLSMVLLLRVGFKKLTPEQETEIDASHPERIWPFYLWMGRPDQPSDTEAMLNERKPPNKR